MKITLASLLLIAGMYVSVSAQEDIKLQEPPSSVTNGQYRMTTTDIYGYECTISGTPVSSEEEVVIARNRRFSVLALVKYDGEEYLIIDIWKQGRKWFHAKRKRAGVASFNARYHKNESDSSRKYYRVSLSLVEGNTLEFEEYSTKFDPVAGPLVIPVKLRSNPFEFTSDVSFGAAIGFSKRFSAKVEDNKWVVLFSSGISSITADSTSTKGTLDKAMDIPAFYMSGALVLSLRNNFSMGFFGGVDLLSARNRNNWRYHGEPWFGIGIGIGMFNLSGKEKAKDFEQD